MTAVSTRHFGDPRQLLSVKHIYEFHKEFGDGSGRLICGWLGVVCAWSTYDTIVERGINGTQPSAPYGVVNKYPVYTIQPVVKPVVQQV